MFALTAVPFTERPFSEHRAYGRQSLGLCSEAIFRDCSYNEELTGSPVKATSIRTKLRSRAGLIKVKHQKQKFSDGDLGRSCSLCLLITMLSPGEVP